jgi:hypothetical protein
VENIYFIDYRNIHETCFDVVNMYTSNY